MYDQPTVSPRKRSLTQLREWKKVEWKKKLRRFEKAEEKIKKFPLGPQYKAGLRRPSPVWRLFPRQKLAFDFARCCKQDVHVFACEVEGESENGQRKYLVTTYEQFWDMYSVLHPNMDGHFYEVIPEGATSHLYFDLEFSKVVNPGSDGVTMVSTLIRYICWFLKKKYNLTCTEEHVLDLESSTEEKFSHHLIFHLPGAAFQDNRHAGNFVHEMCEKLHLCCDKQHRLADDAELQELVAAVPGLDQLFVKNKDGERVLFIDEGVYTKNRNFRLYKSTKLGRRAPLTVAPLCKYKLQERSKASWEGSKASWDKQVFLDSLVSNVRFSSDLRVLRCEGDKTSPPRVRASCEGEDNSSGRESTEDTVADQLSGHSGSPYPEVDAYVVLQACRGGVHGGIRQWTYFSQGEVLMYDIAHNRWCENIGRPHRSNHIMLVADLKRQVWYQKCHDPVCRAQNYKSPERPLPAEVLPAFILEEDQLWDSGVEDEHLLSALTSQASYEDVETDSGAVSWDTCEQEPSDQDLLAASDTAMVITAAKSEEKSLTITTTEDTWEVSDNDLLSAENCCHGNDSRNTKSAVEEQGCCFDNDSRKIRTAKETSDNELLAAATCCHDNDCRKTKTAPDIGEQDRCHDNNSGKVETIVENCEVSKEDQLAATLHYHSNQSVNSSRISDAWLQRCHDDNSRTLQTTVDSCEISDEDLLLAAQSSRDGS